MNILSKKSEFNFLLIGIFIFSILINHSLYSQDKKKTKQQVPNQNITVKDINLPGPSSKLVSLSMTQRDSLVKPEEGMVIFNSTTKRPEYFDGEAWFSFHNDHFVGERFGGGIVIFVDNTGKHGLIAAPFDQSSEAKWGYFDEQVGANNKTIGGGKSNTEKVALASKDNQIASRLCNELILGGYDDWFLPSMDELNLMYTNLKISKIGKLSDALYWSSSETDFNNAWLQDFATGVQKEHHVNKIARVRAIRAF
jgi:hypothetical protein